MKKQDKKLFEDRFNIFLERLTAKKKLNDEQKAYYKKTMLNHFKELTKSLDVYHSLFYVFNIPFSIVNFYERGKLRRAKDSYTVQNYKEVIKYFLDSEVSEYKACKYILEKNNLNYIPQDFRNMFRKWYKDIWNQDSYPEIGEYIIKLNRNKNISD